MASTAKRRGPRTEFSDPQLHNRREQLVQAFAAEWGEIGWELRRCQKPSDLIRIFTLFSETYVRDIIAVLCCPSAEPVSSATLRRVRAKRRLLVEPIRQADELKRQAQEQQTRIIYNIISNLAGKPRAGTRGQALTTKGEASSNGSFRKTTSTSAIPQFTQASAWRCDALRLRYPCSR